MHDYKCFKACKRAENVEYRLTLITLIVWREFFFSNGGLHTHPSHRLFTKVKQSKARQLSD